MQVVITSWNGRSVSNCERCNHSGRLVHLEHTFGFQLPFLLKHGHRPEVQYLQLPFLWVPPEKGSQVPHARPQALQAITAESTRLETVFFFCKDGINTCME
jgi:hypothetical protein